MNKLFKNYDAITMKFLSGKTKNWIFSQFGRILFS